MGEAVGGEEYLRRVHVGRVVAVRRVASVRVVSGSRGRESSSALLGLQWRVLLSVRRRLLRWSKVSLRGRRVVRRRRAPGIVAREGRVRAARVLAEGVANVEHLAKIHHVAVAAHLLSNLRIAESDEAVALGAVRRVVVDDLARFHATKVVIEEGLEALLGRL